MKMHYPLASEVVLDPAMRPVIEAIKKAGVSKIWLHGYFYGRMASPIPILLQAKQALEEDGFEVGLLQVPFNHPGNALNPDDPDFELALPSHWRYRIDRHGAPVYYCADIEDKMLQDQVAATEQLRDAGFTDMFMDDDCRQGNWSPEIEGCFCEHCVTLFNERYRRSESRDSLSALIEEAAKANHLELMDAAENVSLPANTYDVLRDWMKFQSAKVTGFMEKIAAIPGVRVGHMVMPDGDERQGLDIVDMKRTIPDCMFRVGEHLYSDAVYGPPEGKALDYISVQKHLNRIGRENTYSETTVFPHRVLSADNLAYKAKMAIAAGVLNIMFMSGTYVIEASDWQVIQSHLSELEELNRETADYERVSPVHFVYATDPVHQEALWPTTLPTLAGFPAKPVRLCEEKEAADLLLIFGNYGLTEAQWNVVLGSYTRVIIDSVAAQRNRKFVDRVVENKTNAEDRSLAKLTIWDYPAGTQSTTDETLLLRDLFEQEQIERNFPYIADGQHVIVIWLKEGGKVLLCNTEEKENKVNLVYGKKRYEAVLPPLTIRRIEL